jgi:hypothetical protein
VGGTPRHAPCFVERLTAEEELERWLARRNMADPWFEGNMIVNLGSFYSLIAEDGEAWAEDRLRQMLDWHDEQQNPRTGFWHAGDGDGRTALLNAMAGAAHNLHLYYHAGRPVPRAETIVDSCLKLGYLGIRSACVDIDMIDILVHLRPAGHRVRELDAVLRRYLVELLQVQNRDGGFADSYVSPSGMYGHTTPAGASVTWTTWFRLASIGMIAVALMPDQREQWNFRRTIGMGYCNVPLVAEDTAGQRSDGAPPSPLVLSVVRNGRFARQRALSYARARLRRGRR